MNKEDLAILNCVRLPGRLRSDQAAVLIGLAAHDIPILIRARLLKPLGNPPKNAVKYFAAADLVGLAQDVAWLSRATKEVYSYWSQANSARKSKGQAQTVVRTARANDLVADETPFRHN